MNETMLRMDEWEKLAADGQYADAIVTYIAWFDYVTFVELQKRFAYFFPTKGHTTYELAPNVTVWIGMSEDFAKLIVQLVDEKRIFLHPSSLFTYLADGGMLHLPIVKRLPKNGYTTEHWLPATLRIVPLPPPKRTGRSRSAHQPSA